MKSFMYHYVREDSDDFPYSAHKRVSEFISEIEKLHTMGYGFDNVSRCVRRCLDNNVTEDKTLLLTFDDGLKDHIVVARQLAAMGVTGATFYIPIGPYLTGQILPVHKAHIIRSRFGRESFSLLQQASKILGLNIEAKQDTKSQIFDSRYQHQRDSEEIKLFKRHVNYYGNRDEVNALLDKIIELSGLSLSTQSVYLTRAEIREISSLGFEVGSHGLSHTPMSRLSVNEQSKEMVESKSFLEAIVERPVKSFCYPYGRKSSYTRSTVGLLEASGFASSLSVDPRDITIADLQTSIYEIPRYDCNLINSITDT